MRDIGKNIRQFREEKNMTQEELAEQLFVTRQTVSNYETGRSRPDVETLIRIAEVLGTDVNTVIYGKEIPPEQRRQKLLFWIGLTLTAVLDIAWFTLYPICQEYKGRTFDAVPTMWLVITVLYGFLLCLGWTIPQGFHALLGAKRLTADRTKWIRCGCLVLIISWFVLALLPVADATRLSVIQWQRMKTHTGFSSADFQLPQPWQSIVWNPVSSWLLFYISKYWAVIPVFGAVLWFSGFPKGRIEAE